MHPNHFLWSQITRQFEKSCRIFHLCAIAETQWGDRLHTRVKCSASLSWAVFSQELIYVSQCHMKQKKDRYLVLTVLLSQQCVAYLMHLCILCQSCYKCMETIIVMCVCGMHQTTAPKTPGCLCSQRRDWLWEATEVHHHCSIGSPSRTKLPQHQTVPLTVLKTPCPFCVPLQAVLKNPCLNVSCTQDPVPDVLLFI